LNSNILCAADLVFRDFVKDSTETLKTVVSLKRLWGFTVYLRSHQTLSPRSHVLPWHSVAT